jgi:hypothetical protein
MINVLRAWIKNYCVVRTTTTTITITPRKDQGQELVILYILVWQPFSPIIDFSIQLEDKVVSFSAFYITTSKTLKFAFILKCSIEE